MQYPSNTIARALLRFATQDSRTLTPMELVKLTYLCHGWHLAFTGKPLTSDEPQAWQYGPVYPDLYHSVKNFRAGAVTNVPEGGLECFGVPEINEQTQKIIKSVYDAYKNLNGVQLSALTHQEGTPWHKVWDGSRNKSIPQELIESHFNDLKRKRAA